LGNPQPNVHYYDEDIKLPVESPNDSDEEPPTQRTKSDPPSEEEVLEPLHDDFAIRHASVNPSILTLISQSLVIQCSNLLALPDPTIQRSNLPTLAKQQLATTMTTQVQTATATAPAASTSTPAAGGSANLTIYERLQLALRRSGGGGGGGGGGAPAPASAAQQPIAVAADVKAMGGLPQVFNGEHTKADDFIEEVKGYLRLNQDVAGYNFPIKKVAFTLTLIKGSEVAGWTCDIGPWIDT
jgi:hypothetical protein